MKTFETSSYEGQSITRFMIWMGPISRHYFDLYLTLFCHCPNGDISFISWLGLYLALSSCSKMHGLAESMWSRTMVIYMLRSAKLPFLQSRPSWFKVLEQPC